MTPQRKRASQRKVADGLFSKLVRSVGYCEMAGVFGITCKGALQCSHILSRRYLATRFARINAIAACQAHHWHTTMNPLEWEDWCREQLGSAVYDELRRTAKRGGRVDYKSLIPDLRRQLEGAAA